MIPYSERKRSLCQKAPRAKRCIKTCVEGHELRGCGQKAPSATRCIKTPRMNLANPKLGGNARKHRAPKGALRPPQSVGRGLISPLSHKAPSAKMCIKTSVPRAKVRHRNQARKHRAPKGALRPRCYASGAVGCSVRKHRAPNGALRPDFFSGLPILPT